MQRILSASGLNCGAAWQAARRLFTGATGGLPTRRRLTTCPTPARLERENLLANRVEIDAPLLHVGDVAQVRSLRRAVTDQHVAVGTFARLHAVQEVLNVVLVEVGRSLHDGWLRATPHRRE